jgi:hypothetical protein
MAISTPQALTVSNTAIGLTIPAGAVKAHITCRTAAVWWQDGADPSSAANSHDLAVAGTLDYGDHAGQSLAALRFIRATGSDGALVVTYY